MILVKKIKNLNQQMLMFLIKKLN